MKLLFCIRQQQDASTGGLLHAAGLKSQQGYATLCLTEALKTFRVLHAFVVEAVLENVLGNKDNRR